MKAYRVEESWRNTKVLIVHADSAEEAKRKVRHPKPVDWIDVEAVGEDAVPGGIRVRREPSEDEPDG